MLSNISVNLLSQVRPSSAKAPNRNIINNQTSGYTDINDSVFLNHEKIILPVKQYSNKFLRQHRLKNQLSCHHSILRPKKSFVYTRKQLKNKKDASNKKIKEKQNQNSRALKTQFSILNNSVTQSQSFAHSVCGIVQQNKRDLCQTPTWKCSSTLNKVQRISTSRALQIFSKVFKNEHIQRMKIRRELQQNTSDVQVKQLTLQDKEKQQKKKLTPNISKKQTPIQSSYAQKFLRPKLLFAEQENFQIAGW